MSGHRGLVPSRATVYTCRIGSLQWVSDGAMRGTVKPTVGMAADDTTTERM